MKPGRVYLGDLAWALAWLNPHDDGERRAIIKLLGFDIAGPAIGDPKTESPPLPLLPPPSLSRRGDSSPEDEPTEAVSPNRLQESMTENTSRAKEGTLHVELFEVEPVFPSIEATVVLESASSVGSPKPLLPLLRRESVRAAFSEMLGTDRAIGRVELGSMIRRLASAKPVGQLPRTVVRTLARGCDVLVDLGMGLTPFANDRRQVLEELVRVVGDDNVTRWFFWDHPLDGVCKRPSRSRDPYVPPRRGRPVLVVTDLGIGRPRLTPRGHRETEWLDFAAQLREAGCPLIALVPYPPKRWPQRLTRVMTVLLWDRTLTVLEIRRALRDAS